MKKLRIILKYKYIFFFLFILLTLIRTNINNNSKYNNSDKYFVGTISDYTYKNEYITFILKGKEKIKCNYYINNKLKLNYGDKVYLKGNLEKPKNNTIFNTFNYKKYLNNNSIYYILKVDKIIKTKHSKNIIYKIKNIINERINRIDKTGYLKTFILGNKTDIDNDIYDTFKSNGIMHIFSISGMHISLLAIIILLILNKISKSDYNILIVIIVLFFYMILTNYQASIVRSVIFFSLNNIFKKFKIKILPDDVLLISIILILLIYPKYLLNIGFLYSSIISFTLIKFSKYFKYNYFINIFLISIISNIVSLPITINIFYSFNLFSVFINLIIIPLVCFIVYPLSLIVFLIPKLYFIFIFFINLIEKLSIYFSAIKILNITFPKMNLISIIIYYLLIIIAIRNDIKYLFFLILYLIILKLNYIFYNNIKVYILDVNQGDMIVLKNKNNNILIDTGPSSYYSSNKNVENKLLFFKSININKFNYFIISHGDFDHMGEAINLVNNFKVENVIFNCGDYNELEQELIKVLDKKNIKYYSCIKELNIDKYKLQFLNTKEYDNENDNSNVVYFNYNDYKFLFMGDAGIEKEKDILEKYNLKDIDFLKVGHHGSNTSSSELFIDNINPKYSLISVGKNNRYGHPKEEVLETLKKSKIYRTDIDGSIEIKLNKNGYKIRTCPP